MSRRRAFIPKRLRPTNKWWVGRITALQVLLVSWVSTGWDDEETIGVIGLTASAIVTYITRNDPPEEPVLPRP